MKFLKDKKFDFTQLTELEHRYLNYVVYLDYLYSMKKEDDDSDDTFDLTMDWTGILITHDTEVRGDWNDWEETELEKKYNLFRGMDFVRYLRNSKNPLCFPIYLFLYDTYCERPSDFNLKEITEMFNMIKDLKEVEV